MKTLIAYYSRTGTTRKVALALAERLGADVEELKDTKERGGPINYVIAGKDAAMRKLVPIEPVERDPAAYGLVVVGTPVWAGTMATAVRAYLTETAAKLPQVAFFSTFGGGPGHALADMQELAGRTPVATLAQKEKHIKKDEHLDELEAFVGTIRAEFPDEPAEGE